MSEAPVQHPPLFLASRSPRRQELLKAAGISFSVVDIEVPENHPPGMEAVDIPLYLARKKAEAAIPIIPMDGIVLTADSLVILDDVVFGKPASDQEVFEMLEALSGRHHLVTTGVFIGNHTHGVGFSDHTSVWFNPVSKAEIEFYLRYAPPFDKAGAYGIQDWIGWSKVSRIEGSYANVMGLPVHRVYEALQNWNQET